MCVSLDYLTRGDSLSGSNKMLRTFVCTLGQDMYMPVYSCGRHDDEPGSKTNRVLVLGYALW